MIVVLFVFLLSFSSCSNDKDDKENIPQADYKAMLTSHEWEITSAIERMGSFGTELKNADAFCKVSADSIYFQKGETNHYFDSDGKITSKYEITPCGSYPYSIEGEKIKIESQIFMITSQAEDLILTNEDWRLVLKNK